MMITLEELVKDYNVNPKGIVHIGAHEGQELEAYLEQKVPKVVWIEANPVIYETLKERLKPHPHHQAYQFAAHEIDGSHVDLNVMVNTMSSSILYPKKHLEFYPHITVTERIRVPTRTMDRFFEEEQLDASDYDFLNMDIQGAELLALRGFESNLKHFNYVYTEVNDDELFEGCCRTEDMDKFLGRHGFERVAKRMTSDKWGDALYRRIDDSAMRSEALH